jgi:hypothetical protein
MYRQNHHLVFYLLLAMAALVFAGKLQAQNLAYEGETGIYITPLAYTVASPKNNVGTPSFAFHFLQAGNVVGSFSQISVTEGAFSRLEFGYTRDIHTTADKPELSPLWHDGFNIFHAKVNVLPENLRKHMWVPAISAGFITRSQLHNIGGAIFDKDTNNSDVYIVATKTIVFPKLHGLPLVLNGGFRGTNAELFGVGGNATRFEGRSFGAVGFGLKGPWKSVFLLASEVSQQPPHPEGLGTAVIPTTITYAFRLIPLPERKFNIDLGVAQLANRIAPGVELHARNQFGMGVSYSF